MKVCIGVRVFEAIPMTFGDFCEYKGYKIQDHEDPSSKGYIVQFQPECVSWIPKKDFEEKYAEFSTYSEAYDQANIIRLLLSSDWKKRLHGEHLFIQDKINKLIDILDKYITGKSFLIDLLVQQLGFMQGYLDVLKAREHMEKITECGENDSTGTSRTPYEN